MKKLIIVLVFGFLAAFSAFAQLSVGAYAKSYWIPYRLTVPETGDTTHTTAVQVPWGEPDISGGINFDGWSEFAGLHLGLDVAYGAKNQTAHPLSAQGSGWVWIKPLQFAHLETLTLYLGNPNNDSLTGRITGSNLGTYVLNTNYDKHSYRLEYQNPEYNIFTRLDPYSWGNADGGAKNLYWPRVSAAAMLTYEPVERLFIGAFFAPELFDISGWNSEIGEASWPEITSANGEQVLGEAGIDQDYYDVKEVYKKIQIGAGYDIPGIGFVRLQYIGMRNTIEAAFQVKSLGDLVIDAGVKIPFEGTSKEDTSTYKKKKDFQASVAATYRNYDFRLTGRVDTAFMGSDSSGFTVIQNGLDLVAYLIPSYEFKFGTLGADIGFEYEQKDKVNNWKEDSMQAGAAIWYQNKLGAGTFKTGLVARAPLTWKDSKSDFELFIPVVVEIGF
jgi:hypothetical protein